MNYSNLPHKSALVTGSSKGIGRGIALALARVGFDVAVHYRNSKDEAEDVCREIIAMGQHAIAISADLTQAEEAKSAIETAHRELGGLGVLVNNIGNYVHKPLLELELDEWHDMLNSNLNSTFYTCRSAIPLMRGGGRIINLGYAGSQNLIARPGIVPYVIAKTGVVLLTKAIAKSEIANHITANVIAPGVIETSVSRPIEQIPAGRLGQIDELVQAVLYFVADETAYITGQVLEIAGGWNL